jgi:tripartite-type tricarboxylate transporter receptor subunit TctC
MTLRPPDLPTVAETIPGFEYVAWNGCAVTDGVPIQVTRAGSPKRFGPSRSNPEVVKRFPNLGIQSVGTTPDEATDSIRKDMPIYTQIADMAGVRRK